MSRRQPHGNSGGVYERRQRLRHERAGAGIVRSRLRPLSASGDRAAACAGRRPPPWRRRAITRRADHGRLWRAEMAKTGEPQASGASGLRLGSMHPLLPWLATCILLLPLPFFLGNAYTQFVVNVICINIILAVGLNIVKGFAGQVTVGHIALAAIGAYASAVFSTKLGLPFWGALPAAMLLTACAGAIVGVPSFRLEGAYLALATLGLAEAVRIVISGTDWLGAAIGYEGIPPPYVEIGRAHV